MRSDAETRGTKAIVVPSNSSGKGGSQCLKNVMSIAADIATVAIVYAGSKYIRKYPLTDRYSNRSFSHY